MKKHIMIRYLMIITILFFAMLLMIQTGNAEATEEDSLYICNFPITVKINGDFSDWPANIVWQKVTHDMGWDIPDNDEDASFEFACVADNDYLYVGARIRDDRRIVGEDIGNEVCMDDSVEIYIDGDNSKPKEYEPDVSQITIGRYNAGKDPTKPMLNSWTGMNRLGKPASQAGIIAAVVDLDFVWAVEAAIPLNAFGIKLEDGKTVGFNIKLNDDDDGGNRDHNLGWSKIERQDDDSAYEDPSVFGELKFTSKKEEKTGMKEDKKLVINVDRYRVMDPIFEGIRVIMSYRGEKYSPEYIQGISGAAFRISGICPCATTCSWMMNPYDLPKLLGYKTDCLFLNQEGIDKKAVLNDIIAQVKEEIKAGRPVLVWNAFTTAEWDVVCGFDDEKKQFIGRGSYEGLDDYAIADEKRTAEWIPSWSSAIFIKDKVDEFNAQEAEIASLKEAVKHAHTVKEIPADGKWVRLEGLQCYDRWVNDFQNPSKKRELGDLICIIAYSSTHRAAGGFMKELMPKYPEAKQNLEKASEYFIAEANILDQCNSLIGHNTPEGPDADRNAKVTKLLKQARDNYANAINEIEQALKEIDRIK